MVSQNYFYVLHSSVEYWGRAWADYCYISYIASSTSDISAHLVCMALHPQITRRAVQCRAHVDMNVTKQQYSQPWSWSVVSDSHWHVGKLPGSYSSTTATATATAIVWKNSSIRQTCSCSVERMQLFITHVSILDSCINNHSYGIQPPKLQNRIEDGDFTRSCVRYGVLL